MCVISEIGRVRFLSSDQKEFRDFGVIACFIGVGTDSG